MNYKQADALKIFKPRNVLIPVLISFGLGSVDGLFFLGDT